MGPAVDGRSTFRGLCNRQPAALWILMGWPYALFSRRLPSRRGSHAPCDPRMRSAPHRVMGESLAA